MPDDDLARLSIDRTGAGRRPSRFGRWAAVAVALAAAAAILYHQFGRGGA